MVESHTIGEVALISEVTTVLRSTKSAPKTIFAISMVSSALSGCVTEPMNGLSEYRMWAWTMFRCRLFTGRSTGSHTVPPEWCLRSEERRVGEECVRTGRSRGSPDHSKKKTYNK